jgi:hypothetical protein
MELCSYYKLQLSEVDCFGNKGLTGLICSVDSDTGDLEIPALSDSSERDGKVANGFNSGSSYSELTIRLRLKRDFLLEDGLLIFG